MLSLRVEFVVRERGVVELGQVDGQVVRVLVDDDGHVVLSV